MGPFRDLKIIEMAGIGSAPFCGMVLSVAGTEAIRVERVGTGNKAPKGVLLRDGRLIGVDLKRAEGVDAVLSLIDLPDAVFEGFRSGVIELLGLGFEVCLDRDKKLWSGG